MDCHFRLSEHHLQSWCLSAAGNSCLRELFIDCVGQWRLWEYASSWSGAGLAQGLSSGSSNQLGMGAGGCRCHSGLCHHPAPRRTDLSASLCGYSAQSLSEIWATSSKGADKDKCLASVWFLLAADWFMCIVLLREAFKKLWRNFCGIGIHWYSRSWTNLGM